jgi:CheY-like chemotaxis protein
MVYKLKRPAGRGTHPGQAPFTVLVADDDFAICLFVKHALSPFCSRVLIACNGGEALDLAQKWDLDLALIDPDMSGIDGLEAIKVLHMSEPDLPIAAITGNPDEAHRRRAREWGGYLVLEKPLRVEALVQGLGQLLKIGTDEPQTAK